MASDVAVLNKNIKIVESKPIVNSKASETYVSVEFIYEKEKWCGYVPIEYRRTGLNIDFHDTDALYRHLNFVYDNMKPELYDAWKKEQDAFWSSNKAKADVTKSFFDVLATGGWKCGSCTMPRNSNPQRRIQDLKEFGYTIATSTSMYCPRCKRNTSQRMLLPIPRKTVTGNGYETWSPELRARIISVLGKYDVYECVVSPHCLPDHKFSEIRWDDETKSENPNDMTDEQIRAKFQLLTNQRNQQKREVCRNCFQTGKRGTIYGIVYYYQGSAEWDKSIPQKGKAAEKGCVGCPWYDIEEWRKHLLNSLNKNKT